MDSNRGTYHLSGAETDTDMDTRPATAWQTLRRRATRSLVAAVADATVTAEDLEQFARDCRSAAIDLVDLSARAQRAADERRGQ